MKILWEHGSFSSYERVLISLYLEFFICKAHLADVTSELGKQCDQRRTSTKLSVTLPLVTTTTTTPAHPQLLPERLASFLYLFMPRQLTILEYKELLKKSRSRSFGPFINLFSYGNAWKRQYINLKHGLGVWVCGCGHMSVYTLFKLLYSQVIATTVTKCTINVLSTTVAFYLGPKKI